MTPSTPAAVRLSRLDLVYIRLLRDPPPEPPAGGKKVAAEGKSAAKKEGGR